MNTSLQTFDFNGHALRIFPTDDGQSFYAVAKDATDILGYQSAKDGLRSVPDKHKGRRSVPTLGGTQEMLCVDESGLYRLILRSDKPEAEPFMEWVTSEVLPSIRKTGQYNAGAISSHKPSAFWVTYDEWTSAMFASRNTPEAKIDRKVVLQVEKEVAAGYRLTFPNLLQDMHQLQIAHIALLTEKLTRLEIRVPRKHQADEIAAALRCRQEGFSYRDIGELLNRSKESVNHMVRKAEGRSV